MATWKTVVLALSFSLVSCANYKEGDKVNEVELHTIHQPDVLCCLFIIGQIYLVHYRKYAFVID